MRKNKSKKSNKINNKKPIFTINYNNGCLENLYNKNSLMYLLLLSGDPHATGAMYNNSLTVVQNKGIYTNNYVHIFSKCKITNCNLCKEYNNFVIPVSNQHIQNHL
jgi:hypothetical protein